MKNCAIFLACDDRLIFALGNTILQLKKFKFIDNIIIYTNIEDERIERVLHGIDDRVIFFKCDKDYICSMINFYNEDNSFIKKYGIMPFTRYLAFNFLDEYKNIIICDIDMLFMKDFSGCITEYPLSWRPTSDVNDFIDECPKGYTYPNGGFIVINNNIKQYIKSIDVFFEIVNKFKDKPHVDELAFGYAAYKYNIPVNKLHSEYNTFPYYNNSRNAIIVHGVGKYKFWTNSASNFLFGEWNIYNNKWNEICNKNDIEKYKYNLNIKFLFTEQKIFELEILNTLYNKLFSCNKELTPFYNLKWNFIKIFINGVHDNFHFEIKPDGGKYLIQIHDENENRVSSNMFKILFKDIFQNINDIKFKNIDSRFDAYMYSSYENINNNINYIYNNIKRYLSMYLYVYSLYYKFKFVDMYIKDNNEKNINIFKIIGEKCEECNNIDGLTVECSSNKKCYIFIEEGCKLYNVKFICGNNDIIIIRRSHLRGIRNLNIDTGHVGKDRFVYIDENCSCESMRIAMANESFLSCIIENECMLSSNITIRCTDGHTIYDKNNNIINYGKYVHIGKHVWVGASSTILKGTIIGNNCIVATESVVSGKKYPDNTIIAGNPARIVKEDITWDRAYLG